MKKQNIAIIGVIAFVLAIAVGYALFSETITVTGTATAKGSFDVEFTKVGTPTCSGFSEECTANNLAVISEDKNTLTVTVNKLQYPGAYVEIPVTVTNVGTIPAILTGITESGIGSTNSAVKVTYSGIAASDAEIAQGTPANMVIRVEWDKENNNTADKFQFSIGLNYTQKTVQ